MDHKFVQLMCWLIGYNISESDNNENNKRHKEIFSEIYNNICSKYDSNNKSEVNANSKDVNQIFNNYSEMGNKMIKLYSELELESQNKNKMKLANEFDIKRMIGNGTYGCVFEAEHNIDNEHYAIKMIQLQSNN
jgi:hypothetical protein